MENKQLSEWIAKTMADKKARNIIIMDMREISMVTDYFIICSAGAATQVKAIADHVEETLDSEGVCFLHKEGYREGRWILMDYGDCVAHIFVEEDREFYNLERLWGEAPQLVYED